MYRQHFNLEKKPFQISSDNEFLWLGKNHATALALLEKGIEEHKGLLVLTGDVGTGKTTLVNEMIHTRGADTLCVKISDPCFEMYQLFEFMAQAFGFEDQYEKTTKFSSIFFPFVTAAGNKGKKVLVVVDEAHRMPGRFLKEVFSWSSPGRNRILTVLLAGQLEFQDLLKAFHGPAWKGNIPVHACLEPLTEEDTRHYINTRLEIAGACRKIFIVPAIHEVHAYSKGIPRLINISCDQALISAFAKGMKIVDAPTVKQVAHELRLPVGLPGSRGQRTSRPANEDSPVPDRSWFLKKTAWTALAAGICLFAGYFFYPVPPPAAWKTDGSPSPGPIISLSPPMEVFEPPTPSAAIGASKPVEHAVTAPQEPAVTKKPPPAGEDPAPADGDMGLGYTPSPSSKAVDYLPPVLQEETTKNPIKNLELFVEDVFLLTPPLPAVPESGVTPDKRSDMGQTHQKPSILPAENSAGKEDEAPAAASPAPEPDAIIDWLIHKRAHVRPE